jgi:hypothetical protein
MSKYYLNREKFVENLFYAFLHYVNLNYTVDWPVVLLVSFLDHIVEVPGGSLRVVAA